MLIVTFDEASTSDSTACCNEQPGPSSPLPGITGPGGGRVGAVVISPFTSLGGTNATPYNHYALLRSIEDLFGLGHLGMAGAVGLGASLLIALVGMGVFYAGFVLQSRA